MDADVKARVKLLVQQAVETYINEHKQVNVEKPSIAILLDYQTVGATNVLKAVTNLMDTYDSILLVSKKWFPMTKEVMGAVPILMEEIEHQELLRILETTSLLVIPQASYQLLSKLALMMDDDLAVWTALQYQLLGKPIIIANDGVELQVNQQILAPHSVQGRLQSYIRQLQSDQVKWVPLRKLFSTVNEQYGLYQEKQPLILAKHVESASREGLREIKVPEKSKLTPVAKDLARELKIQINRQNS